MSYELKAILEYDAARLEIKELGRRIAEEMGKECLNPTTALTLESYLPNAPDPDVYTCIDIRYQFNKDCMYADEIDELDGGMGDAPDLCERCQELHLRIQDRKQARQRFGIAKTRLSRIARDYRNSFVIEPQ